MTATHEAGGATVLTVGAAGAVAVVLAGVLLVAATVRDAHRARGAADLAALAAASALPSGGGVDCRMGASVASANGGSLTRCVPGTNGSVLVTVSVARRWVPGWRWLPATVTASARAGLVDAGEPS